MVAAITSYAALLVNDGVGGLGYAIYERGLAHIGTAHDCDDG